MFFFIPLIVIPSGSEESYTPGLRTLQGGNARWKYQTQKFSPCGRNDIFFFFLLIVIPSDSEESYTPALRTL